MRHILKEIYLLDSKPQGGTSWCGIPLHPPIGLQTTKNQSVCNDCRSKYRRQIKQQGDFSP